MSRVSNGAQNGVIAYGLDEFGNYMPLQSSSTPNFSSIRSLQQKYSGKGHLQGSVALTSSLILDVVEDRPVFIHGFYITTSMDIDGFYPLNAAGVEGLNSGGFFEGVTFLVDGVEVVNFLDGYISDLASLTKTAPPFVETIVPPAVPKPFRFVGGYIDVGVILDRYVDGRIQVVSTGSGLVNAYMSVQCIYSPMQFSVS